MSIEPMGIKLYTKADATLITPEMASEMLSRNRCIKRLDINRVKIIASDIKNNNYKFNGDVILLDNDGYLINGQVRLNACVEANMPILSFIVIGMNREAQYTKDTGRSRNIIQLLNKKGYAYPKALYQSSLILNTLLNSDSDTITDKIIKNVSNQNILDIIESSPDLTNSIKLVMTRKNQYPTTVLYHLITLDYLCRYVDDRPDLADEFLDVLAGIKTTEVDHPVFLLRLMFMSGVYKTHTQISRKKQIALIIKAYNMLKLNQRTSKLAWAENNKMPTICMLSSENWYNN